MAEFMKNKKHSGSVQGCYAGFGSGRCHGCAPRVHKSGSFQPVNDMVGGGPFHLEPGMWTDDTSLALCLATSLTEKGKFDPVDQLTNIFAGIRKDI